MNVAFRSLSDVIGAEVFDVDLSRVVDDDTFARIHEAWLEAAILLFRGQEHMTVADHIAFSRRFGRLETNLKEAGASVGTPQGGQFWHSDLYFEKIPAAASLLHAKEVPW